LVPEEAFAEGRQAPRRARLSRDGRGLRVELFAPDGTLLAHRSLGAAACVDLAAAAAVVLATWEIELRGRGTLGLWLEPPQPPPEPPRAAPASLVVLRPSPPPGAAPRAYVLALGAGVLTEASRDGVNGAVLLDAGVHAKGRTLGLGAGLIGLGGQTLSLDAGQASWRRLALIAGPRWRVERAAWAFEAEVAGVGAWVWFRGSGFTRNREVNAFDPGGSAALRASLRLGPWLPWVGAGMLVWPVRRDLVVEGGSATRSLARVEVLAGAGSAFEVLQ
jgi:hypothetical protein